MREQKPKYIVPDKIKKRVQDFMNEFMESQKLTKAGLARILEEKLGRSGCRTNLVKKFSKATFQLSEVMEILDLFHCELKIIPKTEIEQLENSKTSKE